MTNENESTASSLSPTVSAGRRTGSSAVIPPALRPEDCLAPLQELWSNYADSPRFFHHLAEYGRALLGSVSVSIFEQKEGTKPQLIAFSSVIKDQKLARSFLPDFDQLSGAFETRASKRFDSVIENRQHLTLLTPFVMGDGKAVCLAAILPPERMAYAEPCFVILHLITQFLVQRDLLADATDQSSAFVQATLLVEMFTRTSEAANLPRALFMLSSELETFFGCRRVAIGTGNKRKCRVQGVSGMSGEDRKGIGINQLSEAMKEAIALEKILVWPSQDNLPEEVVVSANHDDLLHSFRAESILIAPLMDEEDRSRGAIALIWPRNTELTQKDYRLLEACQPHISALVWFLRKSKPGRLSGVLHKAVSGTWMKRAAIITALILTVIGLFLPVTYRLPADCRLEPVVRRTVAAPFESILLGSNVKPGEVVRKGQILAELDGREIRIKLAEAIASRSAALKKRDDSMELKDPSNFQMAQLEAKRFDLEVQRLQFRNDNLLIRAPVDGVVLTGNLEKSRGVPVSSGKKLFEIAPLETMQLEISIREEEIRYVKPGAKVLMRLESNATRVWETSIEEIHPVSEIFNGKNVFVAESTLDNESGELRPGMKGSVRILSGKRTLGWILFHRFWDYVRLKVW